jgi:hypothetical protein
MNDLTNEGKNVVSLAGIFEFYALLNPHAISPISCLGKKVSFKGNSSMLYSREKCSE